MEKIPSKRRSKGSGIIPPTLPDRKVNPGCDGSGTGGVVVVVAGLAGVVGGFGCVGLSVGKSLWRPPWDWIQLRRSTPPTTTAPVRRTVSLGLRSVGTVATRDAGGA
jgi:hypothetical protein